MLSRNQKDIIEFVFIILILVGLFAIISSPYITNTTAALLITLGMIVLVFVVLNLLEGYGNVKELHVKVRELYVEITKMDANLIELYVDITELIQEYRPIAIGAMILIGATLIGYYWIEQPADQKSITNSIDMEFVLIPAGEFDMGSPQNETGRDDDEGPVHRVKIEHSFFIGKYEVTQKQWRDIMGKNPSVFIGDNLPVENVKWSDVQEFIKKLNEKEETNKYRLPSEAEWEYATRAGTITIWGDIESKSGMYSWDRGNSGGRTHIVGEKLPNAWGLYDMQGNVWEWVQDKYHNSYIGAPADGSAWESGDGFLRVIRGGSWFSYAGCCSYALRTYADPRLHEYDKGFRLARDL